MRPRWLLLFLLVCAACEPTPEMRVERSAVTTGEEVVVRFDEVLKGRATNQYWVALQRSDAAPSDTSGRIVLERTQTAVRLATHGPGDYEVRLHGSYPKQEHRLLRSIPVKVEGWTVRATQLTGPPRGEPSSNEPSESIDYVIVPTEREGYGASCGETP